MLAPTRVHPDQAEECLRSVHTHPLLSEPSAQCPYLAGVSERSPKQPFQPKFPGLSTACNAVTAVQGSSILSQTLIPGARCDKRPPGWDLQHWLWFKKKGGEEGANYQEVELFCSDICKTKHFNFLCQNETLTFQIKKGRKLKEHSKLT